MAMTPNPQVAAGLLGELEKEEAALGGKFEVYLNARNDWEVARRRYTAVRDAAAKFLGRFPYDPEVHWPGAGLNTYHGEFRFLDLPLADAIVLVLQQTGAAMAAEELITALNDGFLPTTGRAIHAAAINRSDIVKEGDHYRYQPLAPESPSMPLIDPNALSETFAKALKEALKKSEE